LLNDISKLADKYYNDNDLNSPFYNDLTKIIEDNLNIDKEWNQFKVLFEKVHHGFFNRLKQDFPNLTEHDLRFCAYIKIKLRPKEIARILNIGSNSIKTFRNRLKKKLALDLDASLDDFLRNI
jgi:FixJ family two-component response regulator